jgi:hypothetical protein
MKSVSKKKATNRKSWKTMNAMIAKENVVAMKPKLAKYLP